LLMMPALLHAMRERGNLKDNDLNREIK